MSGSTCRNPVLSVILGSNGSGKTTLARNILGRDITFNKNTYGKYTVSNIYNNIYNNRGVVAVGGYSNVCGGVDTVRPLSNAYKLGLEIAQSGNNILMESLLMSGLFKTPVSFYLEMKYSYGYDVEVCFLFASEKESLRRVFQRNGGNAIKSKIVCDKIKNGKRTFLKIRQLGEFRCNAIDTTELSSDEVFEKFKNWSLLYGDR